MKTLKTGDRVVFMSLYAYPSLHRQAGTVTDVWDDFVSVTFDSGFHMACRRSEVSPL